MIAAGIAELAATAIGLFDSDEDFTPTSTTGDVGLIATVTIPAGHTGVIEVGFTAESACFGGSDGGWCKVELLIDGTAIDAADTAFDSADDGGETNTSWESHAMTRVTGDLPAGTYAITAVSSTVEPIFGGTAPSLRLDDMVLTAEIHLTS